jgi:predicted dehydrogenase
LFQKTAPLGKPTFIDKPFAVGVGDAEAMADLSRRHNVPLMSCSSLRYAEALTAALNDKGEGEIIGADAYGPMAIEPTQPGLFWYGIHAVEMLYAALGPGCQHITAATNADHDVITGVWRDGRLGTVRGNRKGNNGFGALIHRAKGTQYADVKTHPKPTYASLLDRVLPMFRSGKPALDINETVEIVRFIEAANKSRESGRTVPLKG